MFPTEERPKLSCHLKTQVAPQTFANPWQTNVPASVITMSPRQPKHRVALRRRRAQHIIMTTANIAAATTTPAQGVVVVTVGAAAPYPVPVNACRR